MLCQFTFENFKSFKNEATLDLCAENISEYDESLIVDRNDSESFLPVISIYGPNGGGKSSVLEAFVYLSKKVLMSVLTLRSVYNSGNPENTNIEDDKLAEFKNINVDEGQKYFKFDDSCCVLPSKFEILFRINENEFKYQIEILGNEIVEENLYIKDIVSKSIEIVFERDSSDYFIGDILENVKVGSIKNTIPLLSHLAITYDIPIIDSIIKWFLRCKVLNYDNPFRDRTVTIIKNNESQKMIINMLNEMDINISDLRTVHDDNGKITDVFIKHKVESGNTSELLFEDESSGTRKIFSLLPFLLNSLKNGTLIIADEIDAKLHPKLLKYIINLFTNPTINKNGAQLIFTSHDLTTMSPKVFRRDEIWFSSLNNNNESNLYSLVQFKKENGDKIRKDEVYNKRYLEGRYGADPYLRRILDWSNTQ